VQPPRNISYFRKALRKALDDLKRINLTPMQFRVLKVISKRPYEKSYSQELIQAIKAGDIDTSRTYIYLDRFLLYDFDHFLMTPLHLAVKYGYIELVDFFIDNGALLEMQDIVKMIIKIKINKR
jgi:ankyrin repeat protein